MKRSQMIFVLLICAVIVWMTTSPAYAVPQLPSSFYGTVKANGSNLPIGGAITAWINGNLYSSTLIMLYENDSVYSIDVPGDDPATPGAIEGGLDGDTIVFKINGLSAAETGIWHSGTNVNLDLTLASLSYLYVPVIIK
jgi:hypothetical protein